MYSPLHTLYDLYVHCVLAVSCTYTTMALIHNFTLLTQYRFVTASCLVDCRFVTASCLVDCRFVTASCLVDYDTVASADKFGNISIVS